MTPFVALASCRELPEPDTDESLLMDALSREGLPARVVPWDGDPGAFDGAGLIVLRSTWNYHLWIDAFLAFIDRHAPKIRNPADVVRWNAHKGYLRALEAEGFPVVPTAFVRRGARCDLDAIAAERGWRDVVVKPAISAASHATRRFQGPPFDDAFAAELSSRVDVMVQPYVPSVEGVGERSIVCIDGAVSHVIRKNPRFAGGHEEVSAQALAVSDAERRFAERLLARFSEPLLYARIDLMRDAQGAPMLSELELIEPSLFLVQSPPAARRLASAIGRALTARTASG